MGDIATLQQRDKVENRLGRNRPSRPPIVDGEGAVGNGISFVGVYFAAVPILCDEVSR